MLDDMAEHHTHTGHRLAVCPEVAHGMEFVCIDCGLDHWELESRVLADAHRRAVESRDLTMTSHLSSPAGRAALVGTINQLTVLAHRGEKVRDDLPPPATRTLYDHLLADD